MHPISLTRYRSKTLLTEKAEPMWATLDFKPPGRRREKRKKKAKGEARPTNLKPYLKQTVLTVLRRAPVL
jgi:hypothetical protein